MKRAIFYGLSFLSLIWGVGFLLFFAFLPKESPKVFSKTEALVVLTGGGDRLEAALTLMQEQAAEKLLISGVHPRTTLNDILSLDAQKISPLNDSAIFLDYDAHSTLENAQQTLRWVQKHHIKTVRLVTAHYHMRRALLEFYPRLENIKIIPHPIIPRAFQTKYWFYQKDILWLLWREYHKYIGALMRYSLNLYSEDER